MVSGKVVERARQVKNSLSSGVSHPAPFIAVEGTYVEGEHTNAWGCVWSN